LPSHHARATKRDDRNLRKHSKSTMGKKRSERFKPEATTTRRLEYTSLSSEESDSDDGRASSTSAMHQALPAFKSTGKGAKRSDVLELSAGDLIYLERQNDDFGGIAGVVFGDANLSTCGVEGKQSIDSHGFRAEAFAGNGPWRFNECVFRLVSKLDYRARDEHRRLIANTDVRGVTNNIFQDLDDGSSNVSNKAANRTKQKTSFSAQKEKPITIPSELELAKERSDLEARENTAALEQMAHGEGIPIR